MAHEDLHLCRHQLILRILLQRLQEIVAVVMAVVGLLDEITHGQIIRIEIFFDVVRNR